MPSPSILIEETADTAARSNDQHDYMMLGVLTVLLLYLGFSGVYRASRTHFWYDEVLTVAVINQQSIHGMWDALRHAVDGNPLPFYLVETSSRLFSADDHIGLRLPAIAGFLCVPFAMLWFVRKRLGNVAGVTAALAVLQSTLYGIFSTQARPYGIEVGLLGLALLVWQRCEHRKFPLLLAVLLAAAASQHFFAIFVLFPLIFAEGVRSIRTGEMRLRVWGAFAAGGLPAVVFLPSLLALRREFGQNNWAGPGTHTLSQLYLQLFTPQTPWHVFIALIVPGTIVASLLLGTLLPRNLRTSFPVPSEEYALAMGFLFLPLIGYFISHTCGTPMTGRYVLSTVLGFALAAAYAGSRFGTKIALVVLCLAACAFGVQESRYWRQAIGQPRASQTELKDLRILRYMLMARGEAAGLPVVISDGLTYLPMAYYARSVDPAFEYVTDAHQAITYVNHNSLAVALAIASHYLPLKLQQLAVFVSSNRKFLLYSTDGAAWDWLPAHLQHEGYSFIHLAAQDGRTLDLVKRE